MPVYVPANTTYRPIVGSMLGLRRGRWDIDPTLGECICLDIVKLVLGQPHK